MQCRQLIVLNCGCKYSYLLNTAASISSSLDDSSLLNPLDAEYAQNAKKVVSRNYRLCMFVECFKCFRLSERHRLIAEGRLPPITYRWQKELWAKRERFGIYGLASGVDPGELWPSIEEVQEEEAIGWYEKYNDLLKIVKYSESSERAAALARLEEVTAAEKKYPELLKEFLENRKEVAPKKSKEELEKEQRARDMLEYYGYEILPRDPRFPVLFEKMTEAKKKAAKLAEKEELSAKKLMSRKQEKMEKKEKKDAL
ncbi:unnamed protein product [Thelazia callipaeda]|uniref:Large ribosomal subunit protein mL64 n=1 Tax=Thelazia callipaeda TaxID=103827 RepID=A0A0N5CMH9_THECL|nr:unnamed protein product [Thelazia callipaeda]